MDVVVLTCKSHISYLLLCLTIINTVMNEVKQFVVLKVWNHITTPTVVGHFDTEADAREFADLSHKTDLEYKFAVARTVYVTN